MCSHSCPIGGRLSKLSSQSLQTGKSNQHWLSLTPTAKQKSATYRPAWSSRAGCLRQRQRPRPPCCPRRPDAVALWPGHRRHLWRGASHLPATAPCRSSSQRAGCVSALLLPSRTAGVSFVHLIWWCQGGSGHMTPSTGFLFSGQPWSDKLKEQGKDSWT